MVYGVVDAGIVEVAKVALKAPAEPIGTVCETPLMEIEMVSVVAGKMVPLPITPDKVTEAAPTLMDCEGVRAEKVATVEPVPMPLRGALCREAATPLVLLMETRARRAPAESGLNVNCKLHGAPAASVAGGCGHELTKE